MAAGRGPAPEDGVHDDQHDHDDHDDHADQDGRDGHEEAGPPDPAGSLASQDGSQGASQDDGGSAAGRELTAVEAAILEMEQTWWKYAGAKEAGVRERFAMSLTR